MSIENLCLLLVDEINEAIKTSYASKVFDEKREYFFFAIRKLNELKEKIAELPGGYITGLDKFEANLVEIEKEYFDEGIFTRDLTTGWIYHAELKLETPLSALLNHGEFRAVIEKLDAITQEQKNGGWIPKVTTFREMGMDFDDIPSSHMSSIVGPVPLNGGDFLDYLIELRTIIESNSSSDEKEKLLDICLSKQHYYHFNKKLGGYESVKRKLFKSLII